MAGAEGLERRDYEGRDLIRDRVRFQGWIRAGLGLRSGSGLG